MRLSDEVLLEIVDIVRKGIAFGEDISQMLRDLDLTCLCLEENDVEAQDQLLALSSQYLREHRK